ncbi:DUF262 domain-containing protein [Micromonospora sp. WMMD1102]|uniref:DUF262 domain-containing protein n=1 Tax=Micromonospora sp. WMMD1102 TaxID=3016105 RepID=UPI002414FD0B|nr:DUF262 domain-containing protein [Micromonospora sp. WMMD1102]MDG4792056.1 DUF262 domain-containing protein [Micromonospora sp. WMMD1102]
MTRQTSKPLVSYDMHAMNREAYGYVIAANEGELILDLPYQRGSVWNLDQHIALVRSWLTGVPIAAVIVNVRRSRWWTDTDVFDPRSDEPASDAVIDGQQRIRTTLAWFAGEFAVPASWFDPEMVAATEDTDDGPYVRYTGLTRTGQTWFKRHAKLPYIEAKVATLREEAEIFGLVNGGGTPQTDDDMANARRVAEGA